jgi:hypothetical protein
MALLDLVLFALMLAIVAAGILLIGYYAYAANAARADAAARPAPAAVDHVAELRRINVLIEQRAQEAAATATRARDAVRRQTRG